MRESLDRGPKSRALSRQSGQKFEGGLIWRRGSTPCGTASGRRQSLGRSDPAVVWVRSPPWRYPVVYFFPFFLAWARSLAANTLHTLRCLRARQQLAGLARVLLAGGHPCLLDRSR